MTYEKLSSLESWKFQSPFTDSWLTESFSRESEMLTKALQMSFSATTASDSVSPTFVTSQTTQNSVVSESQHETETRRYRNAIPTVKNSSKVSKRKSRASKRSRTTFIKADAADFRRMVQEVTGVSFGSAACYDRAPVGEIVKPEAQRVSYGGGQYGVGWLPTLDTSAYLLERNQHAESMGVGVGVGVGPGWCGPRVEAEWLRSSSHVVGNGDFDTLGSFPTLESWKVMS